MRNKSININYLRPIPGRENVEGHHSDKEIRLLFSYSYSSTKTAEYFVNIKKDNTEIRSCGQVV